MNNSDFEKENIFNKREYDFYDEIVCSDAKKEFSQIFKGLFFFTLIGYAVTFIVYFAIILIYGAEKSNSIFSNNIFQMIFSVLPMYAVSLPAFYFIVKKLPSRKPEKQDFNFLNFLTLIPVSLFFMTIGNYIGQYLSMLIGLIKGSQITNDTAVLVSKSPIWLILILVVIIGPIIEEFIFRKLMIEKISKYGYKTAILISSVAFGLFHGNLYQFFYSTFIGFILGYIFVKSGNWLYSVLMHSLVNLYGSLGALKITEIYSKFFELATEYTENPNVNTDELARYSSLTMMISFTIIGLFIFGAIIFIRAIRNRQIIIADNEAMTIPKGRRAKTVFLNTGAILFLISTALLMILSLF